MSEQLVNYFTLRQKHLFNYLHDLELQGNETALHDFRIEMKKLRALLKFLRSIYDKEKLKKADRKIKAIFLEAGEIREYQQLQSFLQKNKLLSFDKHYFPLIRLTSLTQQFQQLAVKHKKDIKEAMDEIGKWVKLTHEILAEQYTVSLYAKINKTIQQTPEQETWHSLRKLIKQWLYAQSWIPSIHSQKYDTEKANLNKLQEAIGHWHDFMLIKETIDQQQIFLSKDLEVQKDFTRANDKLNHAIRNSEKQVMHIFSTLTSDSSISAN
jgi:CHAD domain-containing protein